MKDLLATAVDLLKSRTLSFAVAVVSWFIVLAPDGWLSRLALGGFRQPVYAPWLGVTALLTSAVFVAETFRSAYGWMEDRRQAKQAQEQALRNLQNLTPEEKGFLMLYVANHADSVTWPMQDGLSGGLQRKGLIYMSTNLARVSNRGYVTAFNLQPWVREQLQNHPELLLGAEPPQRPPALF